MPSITNPFTTGTPVAIANPLYKYPIFLPPYANTPPVSGVPGSYNYTWTSPGIASVKSMITFVQGYYVLAGGLIDVLANQPNNNFGMTSNEITQFNTLTTYMNSISAGNTNIPFTDLQAIITVSQMVRNWAFSFPNIMTQAQLVTATGIMLGNPTITAGGTGYVPGTYNNIQVLNGSGTLATVDVTVSGGAITGHTITNAGSAYTNGTYTAVALTGGSGTGAVATIVVASNVVSTVTITSAGSGYLSTDTLSALSSNIGGTGSGFTLSITASASAVTGVTLVNGGFGYQTGDVMTVLNTDIDSPGGSGFTMTPSTFSSAVEVNPTLPFTGGPTTVVSNDGYFIIEQPNTGNWFISNNQDGTTWNPLMTATIETRSDALIAVDMFAGGGVVLFGSRSLEFWYDAGSFPFPYQRVTGQQQDWGLAAKWSRAYVQNSIVFLGTNFQGEAQILMFNGYTPTRISTSDIEYIINSFPVINDALAYSFVLDGHQIYRITFPTGNRTFDYDSLTGIWNESMSGLTYPFRHLTSLGITYNRCNYASDCVSGSIYFLDPLNYTDNGSYIYREVDSVHVTQGGNEFGVDELFLEMELSQTSQLASSGDVPTISVSKSVDYGNTFGNPRSTAIGTPGSNFYSAPRVIWRRLGFGRDFVFKFITQSAVPFIISMGSIVTRTGTEK